MPVIPLPALQHAPQGHIRSGATVRLKTRIGTGFVPEGVYIPKMFAEVVTESGAVDGEYLDKLKREYAGLIRQLAAEKD